VGVANKKNLGTIDKTHGQTGNHMTDRNMEQDTKPKLNCVRVH